MDSFSPAEYVVPRSLQVRRHAVIYASMSAPHPPSSPAIQRQIESCRRFAEQAGLTVTGAYEDAGVRETPVQSRAGLNAALEVLETLRGMAEGGVLIAENSERIAEARDDWEAVQTRLAACGAVLACAEEHRIGSPTDAFRADIARAIQDYRTALVDEIIDRSVLLSPETLARLRARAQREGHDIHQLADTLLEAALAEGQ